MVLELNKDKYALNMGEDMEFVALYSKGKTAKSIFDFRPLFKGLTTGKLYLMMMSNNRPAHLGYQIDMMDIEVPDPKLIKNGKYKYHLINTVNGVVIVGDMFNVWKLSNPLVHAGTFIHRVISDIPDYTYAYSFNGKLY